MVQPGEHGGPQMRLRRRRALRHRPPAPQHDDFAQIADGVDGKGRAGAGCREDEPADRRPDAAGDVVANTVQHDRGGQFIARHQFGNPRHPRRRVHSLAATDEEGQRQKAPGRQHAGPGRDRQQQRRRQHEQLRRQHQLAAIGHVGQRTRRQRQQHRRQRHRRQHQRHHRHRRAQRRHHPAGAHRLDQPAQAGDAVKRPQPAKHRLPQRRQRRLRQQRRPAAGFSAVHRIGHAPPIPRQGRKRNT